MKNPIRFSILTLLLLTTVVAVGVYILEKKLNPTAMELFQQLTSMIPSAGQAQFLKPATAEQLAKADEVLAKRLPGVRLPADVKMLYRICGGQPWGTAYETELFPSFALNPIENAISDYQETCSLFDEYAKPHETMPFPNTWYDYRLFPFGYAPGTGTLYCVDVETEHIYNFNPDGGIYFKKFDSIDELLRESIELQKNEHER